MSYDWKINFKETLTGIDTSNYVQTVDTYLWGIQIVSVLACIALFLLAANKITHHRYVTGFMTIVGGVIAGISPYLANVFLY